MLQSASPYLTAYQASQYRKHYKTLSNYHKTLLDLHEFYARPAKKGYCIIDDLLNYAYHPESFSGLGSKTIPGNLAIIGDCDFYNVPSKKGYVLGFNGILYTARLDRYNGQGIVEDKIPEGFKGYFLTANTLQHGLIDNVWKRLSGNGAR